MAASKNAPLAHTKTIVFIGGAPQTIEFNQDVGNTLAKDPSRTKNLGEVVTFGGNQTTPILHSSGKASGK